MNALNFFIVSLIGFCISAGGTPLDMFDNNHVFPHATAKSLHSFAFDMYGKISADLEADENMVFSPISVYNVLTLLMSGLNGTTLSEVRRALRSDEIDDLLGEESGMCQDIFKESIYYELTQVNRIFVDKHFQLYKSYKNHIESNHRAPVKKLDFQKKPTKCQRKINRYISKETHQKITDLIPEGGISSLTKMILVNSLYMKAQWDSSFNPSLTTLRNFHVTPTETIQVQTMNARGMRCNVMRSVELEAQMIVLPFEKRALSMVVFMPDDVDDFSHFTQEGAADKIKRALQVAWFEGFPYLSPCDVSMPKFSTAYTVEDMKRTLKLMGINNLFIEGLADFSKMTPEQGLFVSDARHKTQIDVNEYGVEAATATSVTLQFRMTPQLVELNKPFMFLIRHEETGAVLFVGKVVRPQVAE